MTQLSRRNTTSRSRKTLKNAGGRRLKSGEIAGISVVGTAGLLALLHKADKKLGWSARMVDKEELLNAKILAELSQQNGDFLKLAGAVTELHKANTELTTLLEEDVTKKNKKERLDWINRTSSILKAQQPNGDVKGLINTIQTQQSIIYRNSTIMGKIITSIQKHLTPRKKKHPNHKDTPTHLKTPGFGFGVPISSKSGSSSARMNRAAAITADFAVPNDEL